MKKRFFSTLIVVSMLMNLLPAYVVQAEHCPGNYDVLFSTYNYGAANNGPTEDVIVTFDEAKMVKEITTYHWNNGYGKTPGSISIYKDGVLDGTWTATARGGSGASNVNWDVFPDYVMESGHTYKIVDSDHDSWSHNWESGGRGFVEICGYAAEGGTTPDPIEDAKASFCLLFVRATPLTAGTHQRQAAQRLLQILYLTQIQPFMHIGQRKEPIAVIPAEHTAGAAQVLLNTK